MITKSGDTVWLCISESIVYIRDSITPLDCQRIKEYITLIDVGGCDGQCTSHAGVRTDERDGAHCPTPTTRVVASRRLLPSSLPGATSSLRPRAVATTNTCLQATREREKELPPPPLLHDPGARLLSLPALNLVTSGALVVARKIKKKSEPADLPCFSLLGAFFYTALLRQRWPRYKADGHLQSRDDGFVTSDSRIRAPHIRRARCVLSWPRVANRHFCLIFCHSGTNPPLFRNNYPGTTELLLWYTSQLCLAVVSPVGNRYSIHFRRLSLPSIHGGICNCSLQSLKVKIREVIKRMAFTFSHHVFKRLWSSTGMKWRGKPEIPEITRRLAASSGTILICENPGAIPQEIDPGSHSKKPFMAYAMGPWRNSLGVNSKIHGKSKLGWPGQGPVACGELLQGKLVLAHCCTFSVHAVAASSTVQPRKTDYNPTAHKRAARYGTTFRSIVTNFTVRMLLSAPMRIYAASEDLTLALRTSESNQRETYMVPASPDRSVIRVFRPKRGEGFELAGGRISRRLSPRLPFLSLPVPRTQLALANCTATPLCDRGFPPSLFRSDARHYHASGARNNSLLGTLLYGRVMRHPALPSVIGVATHAQYSVAESPRAFQIDCAPNEKRTNAFKLTRPPFAPKEEEGSGNLEATSLGLSRDDDDDKPHHLGVLPKETWGRRFNCCNARSYSPTNRPKQAFTRWSLPRHRALFSEIPTLIAISVSPFPSSYVTCGKVPRESGALTILTRALAKGLIGFMHAKFTRALKRLTDFPPPYYQIQRADTSFAAVYSTKNYMSANMSSSKSRAILAHLAQEWPQSHLVQERAKARWSRRRKVWSKVSSMWSRAEQDVEHVDQGVAQGVECMKQGGAWCGAGGIVCSADCGVCGK
ncbi:hypothetical protein PR048_014781 [Dryococelus australis]|uniref:Uncharacterized protein n=1 Tax=Dryococelus australis TaxID=614101 RepID=A0ABQ9HF44_9NEOP|nr:hypothetical protein PR048_014781 [Dryococelus australis]